MLFGLQAGVCMPPARGAFLSLVLGAAVRAFHDACSFIQLCSRSKHAGGEKEMSQDNKKHMSGPALDIEEIIAQQDRMMKIICGINAVTLVCQVLLLLLKLTGQWSW